MKMTLIVAAIILSTSFVEANAHDCAQNAVPQDGEQKAFYRISCQEYTWRKGTHLLSKLFWRPAEGLLCGAYDETQNLVAATWKIILLRDEEERVIFQTATAPRDHYFLDLKEKWGLRGSWYILEVEMSASPPIRWRALVKRAEHYLWYPYCPVFLTKIDPEDLGAQERLIRFDLPQPSSR